MTASTAAPAPLRRWSSWLGVPPGAGVALGGVPLVVEPLGPVDVPEGLSVDAAASEVLSRHRYQWVRVDQFAIGGW